jgi:hypothetical protein
MGALSSAGRKSRQFRRFRLRTFQLIFKVIKRENETSRTQNSLPYAVDEMYLFWRERSREVEMFRPKRVSVFFNAKVDEAAD